MNKEINEIFENIRTLRIQGATRIAQTIISAIVEFRKDVAEQSNGKDEFIKSIQNIAKKLSIAQPIESMGQNIIGFIIFELQEPSVKTVNDCINVVKNVSDKLNVDIKNNEKKFIENGFQIIDSMQKKTRPLNIFTHCYSSGVQNIFEKADNANIDMKVFNMETRPVFQGRLTAKKLSDIGINVTMCLDSAAPFVVSKKSGRELDIDLILIGADSVSLNGSTINKIGGYGMSLSAYHEKIPVYIVTSLLKIKKGNNDFVDIPVETRSFRDIWPEAPLGINIMNLAFDVIPAEFITGFVTEFGILKPDEIKEVVREHYPRLM